MFNKQIHPSNLENSKKPHHTLLIFYQKMGHYPSKMNMIHLSTYSAHHPLQPNHMNKTVVKFLSVSSVIDVDYFTLCRFLNSTKLVKTSSFDECQRTGFNRIRISASLIRSAVSSTSGSQKLKSILQINSIQFNHNFMLATLVLIFFKK